MEIGPICFLNSALQRSMSEIECFSGNDAPERQNMYDKANILYSFHEKARKDNKRILERT